MSRNAKIRSGGELFFVYLSDVTVYQLPDAAWRMLIEDGKFDIALDWLLKYQHTPQPLRVQHDAATSRRLVPPFLCCSKASGDSLLHFAARSGNDNGCRLILQACTGSANLRNGSGLVLVEEVAVSKTLKKLLAPATSLDHLLAAARMPPHSSELVLFHHLWANVGVRRVYALTCTCVVMDLLGRPVSSPPSKKGGQERIR